MPEVIAPPILNQTIHFERQESGMVWCTISCGGYSLYSFMALDMQTAMLKGIEVFSRLHSFPFPVWNRADVNQNLVGRPVWYREIAAVVQSFEGNTGRVVLRPENPEHKFPPEPWDIEAVDGKQLGSLYNGWVREDLLSPKIYWFRTVEE